MVEMTRCAAGTPSWADVSCPDIDAGIQFYGELFGWEIEKGSA